MKKRITGSQPEPQPYTPPAIVHRGALKQFAGSPLRPNPNSDPLDLPG